MEEINKLGVYSFGHGRRKSYFTKSLHPEFRGFSEKTMNFKGETYREISPERSKFAAAIAKGLSQSGIKEGSTILYLGASHGYTPSFVSDIIGEEGKLFCVEFAPRSMRDLIFLCEERKNMVPLLEDANHPENYKDKILEPDVVYQDIAQRNQLGIFLKNMELVKPGGFGLLALKARSIDVTRNPKEIFKEIKSELEKHHAIVDYRELHPFEKDHAFFVVKKK